MEARTIQQLLEFAKALDSVHEWRTVSDDSDQREKMAYMLQDAAANLIHYDDDATNEEKERNSSLEFIKFEILITA